MKQNGFNEIIAVFACFLFFVPLVCASPTILWEHFSDGNGNPAFDPSFVHTFGPHPERGTGVLDWDFFELPYGNVDLYIGTDTQDYITFLLEPGQYVSHASVLYATETIGSISFVGQHGRQDFLDLEVFYFDPFWTLIETDMSTIGPIQGIVISGGVFDDIRITVVPEPATFGLFALGIATLFVGTFRRSV